MNRVIKFRGKRVNNGEWVYGDLIHGVGSKKDKMYILPMTIIYPKGCNDLDGWDVDPETVGQLTGLLDKNREEIYEGDIIKFQLFANYHNKQMHIAKVVFCDGCFKWNIIKQGYQSDFYPASFSRPLSETCGTWGLQVIGNIHDTPELLNIKY
jgi:uncharacterized phage protein (TIGR01671 family)